MMWKRLADCTPIRAFVQVGKIIRQTDSGEREASAKGQSAATGADYASNECGTKTSTPLEKMSMREYIKIRNKQEREHRRL